MDSKQLVKPAVGALALLAGATSVNAQNSPGVNSGIDLSDLVKESIKRKKQLGIDPASLATPSSVATTTGREYFLPGNMIQGAWGFDKRGQEILGDDDELIRNYFLNAKENISSQVLEGATFLEFKGVRAYGLSGEDNTQQNPRALHAIYTGSFEIEGKRSEIMSRFLPAGK